MQSTIKAKTVSQLIKLAIKNNSKKVEVTFRSLLITDFPKSIRHLPSVLECIGTQKKSIFDVVTECSDIIWLINNPKDIVSIKFI